MASIDWPAGLPQLMMRSGYNDQLPDNLIRDEYDIGPAGARPRSTAASYPVTGSMIMTTEQWEALVAFCADDLRQRALAFGFPAQGVSAPAEWLVRFTAPPGRRPVSGVEWEVSLALEVLP